MRCAILALPEASPAVLFSIYEVLTSVGTVWPTLTGDAAPERRFEVTVVAHEPGPVASALGFPVTAQAAWSEIGQPDIVIVPDLAIEPDHDPTGRWPAAASWLRSCYDDGATVASVCSGSVLLAIAGLLDEREATTHWAFVDLFHRHFPAVDLKPPRILVPTGPEHRIVTSGGAASWAELVLYLIGRFSGQAAAIQAAKIFLLGDRSEGQLPFAAMSRPRRHDDAIIADCQTWIADHYTIGNPVNRMAERSGLSPRTFKRRFRAATGYSPLEYIQTLRIEEAKQLLETTREPVDAIGHQVGYEDPAFFRRLFKRRTGVTPARYRQRFALILGHEGGEAGLGRPGGSGSPPS